MDDFEFDNADTDDVIYLSDDDERERDGVHNPYLSDNETSAASRNDIVRQLENVEQDILDWLESSEDKDARTAYTMIVKLREFLGETPEESD